MTTALQKELKRTIEVDGTPWTVIIDPRGLRIIGKGKRKPQVELAWKDILNGEAGLATALQASVRAE